jgi:hypothetical protein
MSVPLSSGWSIVAGGPGSDCGGLTLFSYNGSGYVSLIAASMQAGQGYWVKATQAGSATMTVTSVPVSVTLVAGWNLIGNSSSQTVALPAGYTAFIYQGGGYVSATSLGAGQGGWVKAASPATIMLNPGV